MSNEIQDYRTMASEALTAINNAGNNASVSHGSGKALIALTMVVGDFSEVSKKTTKQLDILNGKIQNYSVIGAGS